MKTKLGSLLVLSLVIAVTAFSSPAQAKSKSDVRTITGCLTKGDSADEFLLTGNNGSTWEVRSSEVALADHIGHTVTATGAVSNVKMHNMKEDAKDMAADSGVKKSDTEHGHMTVTSLKHVSDTCEK
jgi:hypothetical protein